MRGFFKKNLLLCLSVLVLAAFIMVAGFSVKANAQSNAVAVAQVEMVEENELPLAVAPHESGFNTAWLWFALIIVLAVAETIIYDRYRK